MSLFQNIVIILILIVGAGFLSLTEIALAGARKVKLKILAESGDERAQKVLDLGFGGFEEDEIEESIKLFSQIWYKTKS